jgi:hypothetical protein
MKIFFSSLKSLKKESDPELDPDQLVRGTDPRIRIHTKTSRIPDTGHARTGFEFTWLAGYGSKIRGG